MLALKLYLSLKVQNPNGKRTILQPFYLTLFRVFQSLSLVYSLCRSVVPFLFTMSFIFQSCALEFQQFVAGFGGLFGDGGRTVEASRTAYVIVSSSGLDAHFHVQLRPWDRRKSELWPWPNFKMNKQKWNPSLLRLSWLKKTWSSEERRERRGIGCQAPVDTDAHALTGLTKKKLNGSVALQGPSGSL